MELPEDLKIRRDKVYNDPKLNYEFYHLESTPKQIKEILFENVFGLRKSMDLKLLENIIEDCKKKAENLYSARISVENDIGVNIVVYYYETDNEIIERIKHRLDKIEKDIILSKERRHKEYLELKKEFE